jgi:hypothetical protein
MQCFASSTTEHGRASHDGAQCGGAGSGGGCFDLRKTMIGEWVVVGRKAGGHDKACWTVSDGWAKRKMVWRGK